VVVPARGEAKYLLDCPKQRGGVVGGRDALASTADIHISFDGQLSAPVAPGATTTRYAFFRAVSGRHRIGLFQPRIGCIPSDQSSARSTTAVHRVTAVPGPPLIFAATNLRLRPGVQRTITIGCVPGQLLVDSWDATAFRTQDRPDVGLARAIHVRRTLVGKKVKVSFSVSEALPPSARAEIQLGVKCAAP
jgi:hypothetical protein